MPEVPDPASVRPDPPGQSRELSRKRLRDALLSPSRQQLVVAALLASVGFMVVTQVRATELDTTYEGKRDRDLIELLDTLTQAGQKAEADLASLERTKRDLQDTTSQREAALVAARQEADNLDLLAGLEPVVGPGVRITITEATSAVDINALLDTIQELRTADAEAMEFNDEVRVVAQTAFDISATGIRIDATTLESPYTVDVIGNPRNLTEALTFPGGPIAQLERSGATVDVEVLEEVRIESVRQAVRPQYAQPENPTR